MANVIQKIRKSIKPFVKENLKLEAGRRKGSKKGIFQQAPFFKKLYDEGLQRSGTPEKKEKPNKKRFRRFFNLVHFLEYAIPLDGLIVECGCYKGFSSFLMLNYILKHNPNFRGEGFHIFDSFEGLSVPTIQDAQIKEGKIKYRKEEGKFAAGLDHVKTALKDFPEVTYHKGWIPGSFKGLPENQYKFVHIDLDLYKPIKSSIEYFYPRIVTGGVIVFDDYGYASFPGAKKAVDEYCSRRGIYPILLSSGQAIIWKR